MWRNWTFEAIWAQVKNTNLNFMFFFCNVFKLYCLGTLHNEQTFLECFSWRDQLMRDDNNAQMLWSCTAIETQLKWKIEIKIKDPTLAKIHTNARTNIACCFCSACLSVRCRHSKQLTTTNSSNALTTTTTTTYNIYYIHFTNAYKTPVNSHHWFVVASHCRLKVCLSHCIIQHTTPYHAKAAL